VNGKSLFAGFHEEGGNEFDSERERELFDTDNIQSRKNYPHKEPYDPMKKNLGMQ